MVRLLLLFLGAIPVFAAVFIVIPQITKPEIPITAVDPNDVLTIEYSKQHLKKVAFGVTERLGAQETGLLTIEDDGKVVYSVTKNGQQEPDIKSTIEQSKIKKLTALIKETGFMQIPKDSFAIKNGADEFDKYGLKVTLNSKSRNIQWAEQNATEDFVPPLITQMQLELDTIIAEIME